MQTSLRPLVFWPTFLVLLAAVIASYVNLDAFLATASALNDAILDNFAWLFSLGSLYLLVLAVIVYFSPLGKLRIGGEQATPMLSRLRWFSITLCTTLAVGVLFWTTAEPLYHFMSPPESLGLEAGSGDAMLFAMSTMFLHWSFTPYAIYAVPALIFALAFYNLRLRFSISSMLEPVFGPKVKRFGGLIDAVSLYALVAGMASSLGTGALTLAGGAGQYLGGEASPLRLGVVIALIVVTFVISAASGLQKGIARLSSLNAILLLILGVFIFVVGPTSFMLSLGVESFGVYLDGFFTKSLFTGAAGEDQWPQWWSIFYWAVWFAWAPMAALFLGKISRGYTVREFLRVNLFYPALFASAWVIIFSGAALYFQAHTGVDLHAILNDRGVENVLYELFRQMPFAGVWIPLLLFIAYISYVTAADSQTDAIGNLCTRGLTADSDLNTGVSMKVLWGVIVGIVSWVMVSFVGIDGIKMLSNLGGLPALIIVLLATGSLWRWLKHPERLATPPSSSHASKDDA
ncbi:BCCT transporter [Chromohalobacter japonicus]|uniref:BCCT transporter n=2 Tax=Chromohalobacter TaxID=42054 RepID=A0A1Q8T9P1_9GAMM|nr:MULTISPECIES: BCCT family transporter [Chromohalobacter]MCK2044315.1 BCCT family transporter [Chromohalobacter moromii]MCT8504525.1 BCCT family transporter [Chromohalobacter moromii]OLO10397.1 BCCT transporter [Chromohalobacter japonicus]